MGEYIANEEKKSSIMKGSFSFRMRNSIFPQSADNIHKFSNRRNRFRLCTVATISRKVRKIHRGSLRKNFRFTTDSR